MGDPSRRRLTGRRGTSSSATACRNSLREREGDLSHDPSSRTSRCWIPPRRGSCRIRRPASRTAGCTWRASSGRRSRTTRASTSPREAAMDPVPYQFEPAPAGAAPAAAAHPDRRRRGAGEDAGGGHPRQRADRPRAGPADSWCWPSRACSRSSRRSSGTGSRSRSPGSTRSASSGVRSRIPTSHKPVPLLRQGNHLDRHAEAGCRVPHLPWNRRTGTSSSSTRRTTSRTEVPAGRREASPTEGLRSAAAWRDSSRGAPTRSSCSRRRRTTAGARSFASLMNMLDATAIR